MEYRINRFTYLKTNKKLVNDLTEEMIYMTPEQRSVYELVCNDLEIPKDLISTFDEMVKAGAFVPKSYNESSKYNILKLDIDVNTHCNASCVYCPQSTHRRPANVMPFELFTKIILVDLFSDAECYIC